MKTTHFLPGLLAAGYSLTVSSLAQQPVFRTPGMPIWAASGQLDRFSNDFNPAIGALIDSFGDYTRLSGGGEAAEDDGFDLSLRSFESTINGRVDPNWWGYAVVVFADDEVELEEAAVTYGGFDSNTTVRFGRFFVDFGKQMQAHVHDLPYPDRPGVLAAYLGEELPGVGAQVDHWWTTGESSALRASIGVFGDMEAENFNNEDEGIELGQAERSDVDEFGFTARVTQFMDAGKRGVFQWGLSARHMNGFAFEQEGGAVSEGDLNTTTIGLDLTYGVDSDDGLSGWTFGGEALLATGDVGSTFDPTGNGGTGSVGLIDDDRNGFYIWGERRASAQAAFGLLFSSFEGLDADGSRTDSITAYYTSFHSEFARLRYAVSHNDIEGDADETRVLVQLTTFFGPHAHGLNW